jgi:type I restriction enzyme R subunit
VSNFVAESAVEEACLELFAHLGWQVLYGPDIAPDMPKAERSSYRDVLLPGRLEEAIRRLNPELSGAEVADVIATVRRPESVDLLSENWRTFRLLTGSVPVERRGDDGQIRHVLARLIDFEQPDTNDFVVVNQFTVQGDRRIRRADVVVFVNGIPLAVIELKAPGEERATLHAAFDQLRTYAKEVPALLTFAAVCVVSTGMQARLGPFPIQLDRWAPWKTIDGRPAPADALELEVLVRGVFETSRFLDLVRWFVTYSDDRSGLVKRVARYHQFHAVNRAVESTIAAIGRGDGRAGVVWHTQGSGKSLEMLFYVTKLMSHPAMGNPTVVVLTDRNDLDDQLFSEWFAPARTLPERPVRVDTEKREHLRKLLSSKASGGIVFATMQTFGLKKAERDADRPFPTLSERSNIVVIADEAHRTQYGVIRGLARNLRDGLPKAAFVGFTGTPIETADHNTRAIFGDYIDIYDLTQAIEDEATVKVYYEPRLVKVELPEGVREGLDLEFAEVTERAEVEERERLKGRCARVEAIVGAEKRLAQVAADIVDHWEKRQAAEVGKGLIVCMTRRICVRLYAEIVKLRPAWHTDDDESGNIKVVISGEASEGPEINAHVRTRDQLRRLKDRAKDPDDPLELVIVRDMWLTGFDSPALHTMYVDKPMQGAGLMQAIARVNRAFRDKPGGLVVDYIGIAESLQAALADYTDRDRSLEQAGAPIEEALAALEEHHEICSELLHGCPWREALQSASDWARVEAIKAAVDHLLGGDVDLAERFIHHSRVAHQAFTLAVSLPEANRFRDDLAFFGAVAVEVRRDRAATSDGAGGDLEWETALRQVVSDAVASTGVVDIYGAAGLDRPDLSLIDDEFAKKAALDPHPNLQIALLRRLLANELRSVGKRNVVAERKFSEMLDRAMKAYTNRSLTAAEVIVELVAMAQQLKLEFDRGEGLGLSPDELAFYDAVCQNDAAVMEMGDETLKRMAAELVRVVRSSATIDWARKEQVRASLRRNIRRLLTKYHYPPDKQESAVQLVMRQAEVFADETSMDLDSDQSVGSA